MKPITNAVHLCLDMQTLFAPGHIWATPWMEKVLPNIVHLTEANPARTVFTRFIPPEKPEDRSGMWQPYFRKWHQVTRTEINPSHLELIPALTKFTPPAAIIDKPAYSAFTASNLTTYLQTHHINTLVVTGAETDVCVLSTVLNAVDLGYRVIVASNAICSSSDSGHDALMTMYHQRFSDQIETLTVEQILDLWREE